MQGLERSFLVVVMLSPKAKPAQIEGKRERAWGWSDASYFEDLRDQVIHDDSLKVLAYSNRILFIYDISIMTWYNVFSILD